jgi:hypothetical protein
MRSSNGVDAVKAKDTGNLRPIKVTLVVHPHEQPLYDRLATVPGGRGKKLREQEVRRLVNRAAELFAEPGAGIDGSRIAGSPRPGPFAIGPEVTLQGINAVPASALAPSRPQDTIRSSHQSEEPTPPLNADLGARFDDLGIV